MLAFFKGKASKSLPKKHIHMTRQQAVSLVSFRFPFQTATFWRVTSSVEVYFGGIGFGWSKESDKDTVLRVQLRIFGNTHLGATSAWRVPHVGIVF